MGKYDLPAMIEKIKSKSRVKKITYIGHSQGTTQLFVGFAELDKYFNENLNGFIGLGPVAKINNIKSSFLKAVAEYNVISLFKFLGINEIFQSPSSVNKFSAIMCDNLYILCSGLLQMLSDSKTNFDDEQRFLVFISHFPSGASLKTLKHYEFLYKNKEFLDLNTKKKYAFEDKLDVPIALFVGKEDKLSTPEDARLLRNSFMANGSLHFYKEYEGMGHATFFLTKTKEYINDVVRCVKDFDYFNNVSKSKIVLK